MNSGAVSRRQRQQQQRRRPTRPGRLRVGGGAKQTYYPLTNTHVSAHGYKMMLMMLQTPTRLDDEGRAFMVHLRCRSNERTLAWQDGRSKLKLRAVLECP